MVVVPSFYYKGTDEALTSTKAAGKLTQNFHHELVKDLIPKVEATWNIFAKCLPEVQYFLPMSGDLLHKPDFLLIKAKKQ